MGSAPSADWSIVLGRAEPPEPRRRLSTGRLVLELDGVEPRYAAFGGLEVVRRLHVAVRDHNWDTIGGEISGLAVSEAEDGIRVSFEARHTGGELDFSWHGELAVTPEDTITFTMDGRAERSFRYNRIGLCLLHPPNVAGRPFRARTESGELTGALPREIGAQRVVDGLIRPLFDSYSALEIEPVDGVVTAFEFEGDLFEMEDQRNWTDASFKTYSTPLALGFPHRAEAGQRIAQTLTIRLRGTPPPPSERGTPAVALGKPLGRRLPAVGLGLASHGRPLGERELALLRGLAPDHLRVDVHLAGSFWPGELDRAAAEAAALGSALELALFLGDDAERELARLATALAAAGARVARVLVFREGEPSTDPRWVRLARGALGRVVGDAAFAGGTNAYFTDVNRARPEPAGLDAIAFSVNPQVHAFDEASLVEACSAQAEVVRSARAFSGGTAILVTPVTLRPRFNPNATGPEPEPAAGALPAQVDERQCSLFGAAWTAGSAKHLAEAGAESVTYYETSGWRGVVEQPEGPPLPERFPSTPGAPFPLYHVLADLGEWKRAELVEAEANDPLAVEALAVRSGEALHVLVAALAPQRRQVRVGGLPDGRARVRVLDADSAALAAEDPARFRSSGLERDVVGGVLELELGPYATARIDIAGGAA